MRLEQTEHEKSRVQQESHAALENVSTSSLVDFLCVILYVTLYHKPREVDL